MYCREEGPGSLGLPPLLLLLYTAYTPGPACRSAAAGSPGVPLQARWMSGHAAMDNGGAESAWSARPGVGVMVESTTLLVSLPLQLLCEAAFRRFPLKARRREDLWISHDGGA